MKSTVFLSLQECYTLLQRHGIVVSQEEIERVDTLRYLWQKLRQQVSEILSELIRVQPTFKESLLKNVVTFQHNMETFVENYEEVMSL